VLRITATLIALLATLTLAACGSDDSSSSGGGSGSGSGANGTQTSGDGSAAKGKTTPGKTTTQKPKTAQERRFTVTLNQRCATARRSAGTVAAPRAASVARQYSRRAMPAVLKQIVVIRTSKPSKRQTVAVATLLGTYGQARRLMRTLAVAKGELRPEERAAAKQLYPALQRVRTEAKAAGLPGCRPPGL
jgi:hypothetical protein